MKGTSARICQTLWSVCVLCIWAMMIPYAQSSDGQVRFSGAIVAPTCALSAASTQLVTQDRQLVVHAACPDQSGNPRDEARSYDLRVTQLSADMVDPRVDAYFQGHAVASQTLLATQTYQ